MATGSDVFWKLFQASGHIGAYLLYADYRRLQLGRADDKPRRERPADTRRQVAPADCDKRGSRA